MFNASAAGCSCFLTVCASTRTITSGSRTAPGRNEKGQHVFKFSPQGRVLTALGKAGVAGNSPDTFNMPSAVGAAANGDIFVADGHGGDSNNRIVKFEIYRGVGTERHGPRRVRHTACLSPGFRRTPVRSDRNNNRIQIRQEPYGLDARHSGWKRDRCGNRPGPP
jgi:hypothetical protein